MASGRRVSRVLLALIAGLIVGIVARTTFVGILFLAAGFAWLLAPHLIDDFHVTPETSASLWSSVATTATATKLQLDHLPGFGDWLVGLVPSNAIRAAADGAMLPLIIFTALF